MSLQFGILLYLIIIFSATFHEFMHGYVAYQLGDSTAKDLGRLTLNPLKHIDPIGTVILPLFLIITGGFFIGWAKPVPYNPYNLSDQRYGSTKVGFAGPVANLLIAAIFAILIRFGLGSVNQVFIYGWIVYINIALGLFNMIPIPPLDGSKILIDLYPRLAYTLQRASVFGIIIALFISFYILGPIVEIIYWLLVGQSFSFLLPF